MRTAVLTSVSVSFLHLVVSSNVLGLFPFGSKSHFTVFNSLMLELASRGHNVVVVSPFKDKSHRGNYTAINIETIKQQLVDAFSVDIFHTIPASVHQMIQFFLAEIESNRNLLTAPVIQKLMSNTSTFDVVFVETFSDDVFLLLATKFNAPIIGFSSCYPFSWTLSSMAAPQNPSYIPNFSSGYSKQMTLFEKVRNVWLISVTNFYHKYLLHPSALSVYQASLGKSNHQIGDPEGKLSLLMVNTHFTFYSARPYPPQVVEVGGIHLQPPGSLHQVT